MKLNEEIKTEGTDPAPADEGGNVEELLSAADTPPEIKWARARDEQVAVASATIMKMVTVVLAAVWRSLPAAMRVVLKHFAPDPVLLVATRRLPYLSSAGVLPGSLQVAVDTSDLVAPFGEDEARWLAEGLGQGFLDAWLLAVLRLAREGYLGAAGVNGDRDVDRGRELVAAALVNDVDVFKDQPKLLYALSEGIAQVLDLTGPMPKVRLDSSEWGGTD